MQIYEVWHPHPETNHNVNIVEIIERSKDLRVLVQECGTDRRLSISFDTHEAYQRRNESWIAGEDASGLGKGSFYMVKNSKFASRFETESLLPRKNILHFSIVTDHLCIDILALESPKVEYVEN